MGGLLSFRLPEATSQPNPYSVVQFSQLPKDLQDQDKVVSPFQPPGSLGQGGRVSSRKQFKQEKTKPASCKRPGTQRPQPSLLLSCGPEAQLRPNILTKDLRETFAYQNKLAAQTARKREPGPWKGRRWTSGTVRGQQSRGADAIPSRGRGAAGPALLNLEAKSEEEDSGTDSAELSSSSWEDLKEDFTKAPRGQQALDQKAHPFLRPTFQDPEVFGETWLRPGAPRGQSESLGLPYKVQRLHMLQHGHHVLATAVNSLTRHVFTCGPGGLKVWRLGGREAQNTFPQSHLHWPIQTPGAFLSTCMLAPNGKMLFAGGHGLSGVNVWDLLAPDLHNPSQLSCEGLSCQALDADLKGSLAFAGFSNGTVRIWDVRDRNVVKDLPGRQGEANSVVIKDDTVWTGGLNGCLQCWDLRAARKSQKHLFKSQITSLSHSLWEDWLLVGLASGQHWLQSTLRGQAHAAGHKNGAILGLKFSPYGQWWVSVGTDKLTTIHSMPAGYTEFQLLEKSCITCCDVSASNKLIVTGCQAWASVYQLSY